MLLMNFFMIFSGVRAIRSVMVLFLIMLAGVCLPLGAQNIGDRAIGMGGAYTALADDSSASWYNPAGLVHVSGNIFTISANVYQYKELTYTDFVLFNEPSGNSKATYDSTSFNVFPSSMIYGTRFKTGRFFHGVAFSVLVVDSESSRGFVKFQDTTDQLHMTFETDEEYRDYYIGPSYAVGTGKFSVGTSLFVRFFDKKYTYNLFEDVDLYDTTGQRQYISTRKFSEQYRHYAFIPSLGAQFRPVNGLRVGIRGVFKSYKLAGKTKVNRVVTTAGTEVIDPTNSNDTHSQEHTVAELDTVLKTPWKFRLGIGYLVTGKLAFEVSAEYSGKIDPYIDRDPVLSDSTEAEHNLNQKEAGFDYNAGIEYSVTPVWQVRFGFFTKLSHHQGFPDNFSTSGNNTAAGDHYEDAYGVTFSLGQGKKISRTSYSISYIRGKGEAVGFYTTPPGSGVVVGDPLYTKDVQVIDSKYWKIEFIISGSVNL